MVTTSELDEIEHRLVLRMIEVFELDVSAFHTFTCVLALRSPT